MKNNLLPVRKLYKRVHESSYVSDEKEGLMNLIHGHKNRGNLEHSNLDNSFENKN